MCYCYVIKKEDDVNLHVHVCVAKGAIFLYEWKIMQVTVQTKMHSDRSVNSKYPDLFSAIR